jgi:hypothetical protein
MTTSTAIRRIGLEIGAGLVAVDFARRTATDAIAASSVSAGVATAAAVLRIGENVDAGILAVGQSHVADDIAAPSDTSRCAIRRTGAGFAAGATVSGVGLQIDAAHTTQHLTVAARRTINLGFYFCCIMTGVNMRCIDFAGIDCCLTRSGPLGINDDMGHIDF